MSVSTAVTATNGLLVSKTFTLGSTDASNGLAVIVVFILPASGSFNGSVSASDFQLVTGSVVPEIEHPPTSLQVSYCRRYYRAGVTRIGGYGTTNGYLISSAVFEDMRTTPTISSTYTYTANCFGGFADNIGTTNFRTGCQVTATGMAEFTNSWTASAEL